MSKLISEINTEKDMKYLRWVLWYSTRRWWEIWWIRWNVKGIKCEVISMTVVTFQIYMKWCRSRYIIRRNRGSVTLCRCVGGKIEFNRVDFSHLRYFLLYCVSPTSTYIYKCSNGSKSFAITQLLMLPEIFLYKTHI